VCKLELQSLARDKAFSFPKCRCDRRRSAVIRWRQFDGRRVQDGCSE
jgi:hypothetical protein